MARKFNGTSDFLTGSPGALAGMDAGPITIAAIIKLDADSPGSSICYCGSGTETGVDLGIYGGQFYLGSQEPALAGASTADGWHLVAANKAAGTQTPRWHKYVYGSDTWTHADAGGTMGDGVAATGADTLQIGRWGTASTRFDGSIAIIGVWDRVLSDAEIEQLPFSLQAWYASAPKASWLLDQADAGTSIVDWTGGEANITGGAADVSADSLPVFTYGLDVTVPHSVPSTGAAAGVIACTATIGAPTVSTGSTTAPATVAAAATIPAPTVSTGARATPATAVLTASVGAPALATGSTAAPSTIAAVATFPTSTPRAGSTVSPATAAAAASFGAAQPSTGSTITATTVAAVATLAAPAVSAGNNATVNAATIAAAASVPAPTVVASVNPQTIAAAAQIGTPTLSAGVTLAPATIATLAVIPAPAVSTNPAGVILRPHSGASYRPSSGTIARP